MATKIKSVQKVFIFTDEQGTQVIVKDYREGVPTIRVSEKVELKALAKFIVDSFSPKSNFLDELVKVYDCKEKIPLVAIEFEYLDDRRVFLKKDASKNKVFEELLEMIQQNACKQFVAQYEKEMEFEFNADQGDMHFRNSSLEEKWYELYGEIEDDTDAEVVEYAEGSCRNVEYLVQEQKKPLNEAFEQVYEALKEILEGDHELIDRVTDLAVQYWAGGDELEKWYSKHLTENIKEELEDL